jgi:peptide/nickel transport system substrate-binding protein
MIGRHIRSRLLAALAIVAVVVMVVTACGGDDEDEATVAPTAAPTAAGAGPTATRAPTAVLPTQPPAPTPTAVPTPTRAPLPTPTAAGQQITRGGVYNIRLLQDVTQGFGWDNHQTSGHTPIKVVTAMSNGILMLDELDPTKIKADAAESWSVSADGMSYTVKLRKDVAFHDGAPMTVKDVIFSYKRILGEINTGYVSHIRGNFTPYIDVMEAPDDHTLVVRLKAPAGAFVYSLANLFAVIQQEKLGSEYMKLAANTPIGTGPYRFVERKAGVSITLRKNDRYFKKDAAGQALPYLDGLEYQIIPDSTTALAAFRTGRFLEADYLDPAALNSQIDTFKRELPTYTYLTGYGSWQHLGFGNKAPYTDIRIRTALNNLIDRPGFVEVNFKGIGHPGASPLMPPSIGGSWGLTDQETATLINTGPVTANHIAQAKELFKAAGVDYDKFEIKLLTLPIPQFTDASATIQAQWKKAGLNVTLEVPTQQAYTTRRLAGDFDIYYIPSTAAVDDPDVVLGNWHTTTSPLNSARWSNAKIDQLYTQQSQSVDAARRKAVVADLQRAILTEGNWITKIAHTGSWVGWSPRLRNFNLQCPGAYCFRGRNEITWIAPA